LSAEASLANPPLATPNPPFAADQTKSPPSASDAASIPANSVGMWLTTEATGRVMHRDVAVASLSDTVNTPHAPGPAAPPPAVTSEFPDPKPVRTVALRPDGTPIAAVNSPDQGGSDAKSSGATAEAANKPALDPNAQTPGEPTQNGAPVKPDKTAEKPKAGQVAAATETTETVAAPVDATAATTPGEWSVELAALKSEAEANSMLAQLTSKYRAELNGSSIGVHKAVVKGEIIYRLRVVGLTKSDAAALCARLKGEGVGCFIAK
jgi:hypothetical protein